MPKICDIVAITYIKRCIGYFLHVIRGVISSCKKCKRDKKCDKRWAVAPKFAYLKQLECIVGYSFKNKPTLLEAMTHPSYIVKRNDGHKSNIIAKTTIQAMNYRNYQRLEFLGDKVLGLIVAEMLYHKYNSMNEGQISILHSHFVKSTSLADMAAKLGLGEFMLMDKSEIRHGGKTKRNNLENVYEALIGAIFIDSDYQTTYKVVSTHWENLMYTSINCEQVKDFKSKLQELIQKGKYELPVYNTISKTGEEHDSIFHVEVSSGDIRAIGTGKSKKAAEHEAARALYEKMLDQR